MSRRAVAVVLLLAATAVPRPAAAAPPRVTGAPCVLTGNRESVSYGGSEWGTGQGGPIVADPSRGEVALFSGTLTCTVQVGSAFHHDPAVGSEDANDESSASISGNEALYLPPTTFQWDASAQGAVYVCTEVEVQGAGGWARWYLDDAAAGGTGEWLDDPRAAHCAASAWVTPPPAAACPTGTGDVAYAAPVTGTEEYRTWTLDLTAWTCPGTLHLANWYTLRVDGSGYESCATGQGEGVVSGTGYWGDVTGTWTYQRAGLRHHAVATVTDWRGTHTMLWEIGLPDDGSGTCPAATGSVTAAAVAT